MCDEDYKPDFDYCKEVYGSFFFEGKEYALLSRVQQSSQYDYCEAVDKESNKKSFCFKHKISDIDGYLATDYKQPFLQIFGD